MLVLLSCALLVVCLVSLQPYAGGAGLGCARPPLPQHAAAASSPALRMHFVDERLSASVPSWSRSIALQPVAQQGDG